MKAYQLIIVATLFITALIVGMIGCEYDVAEPQWEQDFVNPPTPKITQLEPDKVAPAGFNTIKILGENFAEAREDNQVYFGNVTAEVVNASDSSLTVRRPNLVSDSAVVKVVSYKALVVAKYSPYKIDPVMDRYGSFVENLQLRAIAVDKAENLYVIQLTPSTVFKVTPDGEKTIIGESPRAVTDAKIGPGGKLVLLMNYRRIYQMNLETGEATEWVDAGSGKNVSFGDFDSNGNFYVGGRRSDLIVVAPNLSKKSIGVYSRDEIFCVRVYNDYVYLLVDLASSDEQNPKKAIWRHQILDADGNLGTRELVLNWANTGEYAASVPQTLTFSDDGLMYIGTNYTHPIMIFDPQNGRQDILYKGILPSYAVKLEWGTENYLYMLLGGTEWNIVRINMGKAGAPYYGRGLP